VGPLELVVAGEDVTGVKDDPFGVASIEGGLDPDV
jgi:hypothetical protein